MNEGAKILKLLSSSRVVAYSPALARVLGGVPEGVFMAQAMYWSQRTEDGWFWKSAQEWEEETALTERQQRRVRKHLVELGVLEEYYERATHRMWYRVNFEALAHLITSSAEAETEAPDEMSGGHLTKCQVAPDKMSGRTLLEKITEKNTFARPSARATASKFQPLYDAFVQASGIQMPDVRTKADGREFGALWTRPCRAILEQAQGDVGRAVEAIREAVKRMRADGLTVAAPKSIEKTAVAILAEQAGKPAAAQYWEI